MRKLFLLLMVTVLAMGLLLTACEETDNITDPEDSEWSVFFVNIGNEAKPESHYVTVMWIGDAADYVEPTTVSVVVDDVAVDLTETFGYWFGETTVVPGEEYGIELIIDGDSKTNTTLDMVYEADVTFPAEFDPADEAAITWTLADDNQSQMASALSFDNADFEEDIYDYELDPEDRSYVFPANAVEDFGDMTTFTLELSQMNYKHRNYIMIVSAQSDYQDYGFGYDKARNTPAEMIKYCRRLLSHIN